MSRKLLLRRREKRRTGRAVLLSLLIHLGVIAGVAWIYVLEITPPPPEPGEIEIVFVEPPAPSAAPVFVDVVTPETEPPEAAVFEADRATLAAAPEAAQGEEPQPTQEGREQSSLEFEDRELALAPTQEAVPAPEMPPAEAVPAEPLAAAEDVPAETSEDEPREIEPDALLAMAEPAREEPSPPREPVRPSPPTAPPAYRPQTRATRLRGSVDSRGRSAVDSVATPLGRYRKAISDAIGSSWYYHIGQRLDMFSYGTLTVVFTIDRDGRVRRPRVMGNSSNESFEIVTLESILAAEIPPIPPDVLPTLEGGQIEVDYSFSIITN